MSETLIEKLLEQRDFYLYTLKHLDFELIVGSTQNKKDIEKLKTNTLNQLKKVEQEIAFLSSGKSS